MTFFYNLILNIINGDLMKRFKPKRRVKKLAILKLIIVVLIALLSFKILKNLMVNHSNYIIKTIFSDNNYYKKEDNIFNMVYSYAKNNIINKPSNILKTSEYNTDIPNNTKHNNDKNISKRKENKQESKTVLKKNNPLIYIYSSHQKESYSKEYMDDYNVNPDVFLASHIMQEKLNAIGINTLVMEDSITTYLNDNKLDYSNSYLASRHFLTPIVNKYSSIKLFIDLHRDSASKDVTTTVIENKSYAKVMFVIGKEYDSYQKNLSVAVNINEKIKSKYKTLSRGIMQKQGQYVNGVYNQDLNENIILIELGGDKNNLDEVLNTISVLVNILGEYINEK